MRKIIIGFSAPIDWKIGAELIMIVENTRFSHMYIGMNPSPSSKLPFTKVFQASRGMVNALQYNRFVLDNKAIHEYELEVTDEEYFEIANWLWAQLGKDYSFWQLVGIALGIKIKANNDSKYICSELAAKVLRILGHEINKDYDYIGLNDVKKALDDSMSLS